MSPEELKKLNKADLLAAAHLMSQELLLLQDVQERLDSSTRRERGLHRRLDTVAASARAIAASFGVNLPMRCCSHYDSKTTKWLNVVYDANDAEVGSSKNYRVAAAMQKILEECES